MKISIDIKAALTLTMYTDKENMENSENHKQLKYGGIIMSLGEKLRSLRHKSKKSLQEQSKLLGVSMNSIYRWEHDLAVPRKPVLQLMADLYSVPLEWLVSESATASLVNEVEQKLLNKFRKLMENSRYMVLGYVERMCVEEYNSEQN